MTLQEACVIATKFGVSTWNDKVTSNDICFILLL